MSQLLRVSGREVVKALRKIGYEFDRQGELHRAAAYRCYTGSSLRQTVLRLDKCPTYFAGTGVFHDHPGLAIRYPEAV